MQALRARELRVDSRDVQQFIGMTVTHHRAERKLYVAPSGFTAAASELGRKRQDRAHRWSLRSRSCCSSIAARFRSANLCLGQPSLRGASRIASCGRCDRPRQDGEPRLTRRNSKISELFPTRSCSSSNSSTSLKRVPRAYRLSRRTSILRRENAVPIDCRRYGGTMEWDFSYRAVTTAPRAAGESPLTATTFA